MYDIPRKACRNPPVFYHGGACDATEMVPPVFGARESGGRSAGVLAGARGAGGLPERSGCRSKGMERHCAGLDRV